MAKEATDLMVGTQERALAELDTTGAAARETAEIQSAVVIAHRRPRDEGQVRERLTSACERVKFAERASYAFPRGGATVTGPSVYLAREVARLWGNLRYGFDVIYDDDDQRTIRCYAWDLESNARPASSDTFRKLIQRKGKGWVTPDERDLRELTNRHAAIGMRNCVLSIVPDDLIEDAIDSAAKTIGKMGKDGDYMKRLLAAFAQLQVTQADLEKYIGKSLEKLDGDDVAKLRATYEAIKNDFSKREEYFGSQTAETGGTLTKDKLKKKEEPKGQEQEEQGTLLTPDQKTALTQALEAATVDEEALNRYLGMQYKIKTLDELPAEHADEVLDWLNSQKA